MFLTIYCICLLYTFIVGGSLFLKHYKKDERGVDIVLMFSAFCLIPILNIVFAIVCTISLWEILLESIRDLHYRYLFHFQIWKKHYFVRGSTLLIILSILLTIVVFLFI